MVQWEGGCQVQQDWEVIFKNSFSLHIAGIVQVGYQDHQTQPEESTGRNSASLGHQSQPEEQKVGHIMISA